MLEPQTCMWFRQVCLHVYVYIQYIVHNMNKKLSLSFLVNSAPLLPLDFGRDSM